MKPENTSKKEMQKLQLICNDVLSFCRTNNVKLNDIFTLLKGEESRLLIQKTIEQPELPFETRTNEKPTTVA